MLAWSTDALPPHQRFDHWREERGRQLFGVTIEMPAERRHLFHGRFSARQAGGATIASMSASAYRVSRTESDIARLPGDSLVVGLQVAGPGWCDTPFGQTFVDAGGVAVGHTDVASQATPASTGDFLFHMLKIPVERIGPEGEKARGLHVAQVLDARLSHLIDAATSALFDDAGTLTAEAAGEAVDHIARLALLARGRVAAGAHESRQALRAGNRHAAIRLMRRHLHRADLSPETVARFLGISLRQLHLIFEPTGRSFSRTLTTMRIDMACRRLAARPGEPVADLAFSCGFDSLATFYRAFRAHTGLAPGDWREAAL